MKKMFGITVVLFILYTLSQIIYSYIVGGFNISYILDLESGSYNVIETFNFRYKTEKLNRRDISNYYYQIKNNDDMFFSFKLVGDYKGSKRFLIDIEKINNHDMVCIYPIFKDHNNQLDVICKTDAHQFNYLNIKGQYLEIDRFVEALQQKGYNHFSWENKITTPKKYSKIEIYENNLFDNQHIVVWNYKGFYNISKDSAKNVQLFTKDQYNNDIAMMVDSFYVVPEYLEGGFFQKIIMANVLTSALTPIEFNFSISPDSFSQGVVNGYLYMVDKREYKQYEVNLNNRTISLVGDKNKPARHFKNGRWFEKSIYDIINNHLMFINNNYIPEELLEYNAYRIDNVMGDTDGYYYLYIKENDKTSVYRIDKQNKDVLTLLFETSNLSDVRYIEDSIYFIENDILYIYRDNLGLRPLIKYNEFLFNQTNMYDVFINN